MQKFLKKDIADLLKNNLDRHAYGRAEGLYVELNLSSCYDYVDECSKYVSAHLKTLHEQRGCPDECKVALSSLIYAAARFSDLPELRDLRNQFKERYGDKLDPCVSKEFVEKLRSKPPTMEMKLQVMEQVAKEFFIAWDRRNLEQQLQINPSLPTHDHGANDPHNIFRAKSFTVQGKDKKEDSGRQIDEEHIGTTRTKIRHTQSLSVVRGDVNNRVDEHERGRTSITQLSPINDFEGDADKKLFSIRTVTAPYTILDNEGKLRNGTDDQHHVSKSMNLDNGAEHKDSDALTPQVQNTMPGSARKNRPRPMSVRTKFLKPTLSSTSSSDYDSDLKNTFSARSPREMCFDLPEGQGEDEDETENDVWTYFGKISPKVLSPSSAKSVLSPVISPVLSPKPTPDQKEANSGKPVSELPLPPGRRRYFSDSQPSTPNKEEDVSMKYEALLSPGKSRFLPAELQVSKLPVERKVSKHSRSPSQSEDPFSHVHPRMPDFDELSERIAVLKRIE